MTEEYINNFENMISTILYVGFKGIVIFLTVLLILSLILLAVGCLIKSQKLKSKFLVATPGVFLGTVFFLLIPYIFVRLKGVG